jgi:hypothetical protein
LLATFGRVEALVLDRLQKGAFGISGAVPVPALGSDHHPAGELVTAENARELHRQLLHSICLTLDKGHGWAGIHLVIGKLNDRLSGDGAGNGRCPIFDTS